MKPVVILLGLTLLLSACSGKETCYKLSATTKDGHTYVFRPVQGPSATLEYKRSGDKITILKSRHRNGKVVAFDKTVLEGLTTVECDQVIKP